MSSAALLLAPAAVLHQESTAFFAIHPLFLLPYVAPFCFQYTNWHTELSSKLGNVKADLTKANNNIAIINSNLISIVERGTKNNYNYTKYSNGDMVMWSKYTWNTNLATSWYNWYFASSAAVGFPVAFKQAPLIIVSPAKTNELYGLGVTEVTTTGYKLTAYSPKQGMCYVQADMLIIGKWK